MYTSQKCNKRHFMTYFYVLFIKNQTKEQYDALIIVFIEKMCIFAQKRAILCTFRS